MVDLLIYESGNGGEVAIVNGDLATTDSLANEVYLAHWGGNVEACTTGEEVSGNERSDWWGNFLFRDEPDAMANSKLERALIDTPLGSSGRSEIERRAEEDLTFMKSISEIKVSVSLNGNEKVEIVDYVSEIDTAFRYLWDGTKEELIELKII